MRILISRFDGMSPKIGNSKLESTDAQDAVDCNIWSGDLRSVVKPLNVTTPTKSGTIRSIYRLGSLWLHWTTDVDVVESPISSDEHSRIYYTGDTVPKVLNETVAQSGGGTDYPTGYFQLGVPAPVNAASVAVIGGGGPGQETRSYVYTYVTQWGEEGSPCPAVTQTGNDDATSWDLSSIDAAPLNTGSISNAVHSSGVVTVTCTANHLLRTGEYVDISSVLGMTDLNSSFQITRISATQFSVVLSTAQTYTSGGTWDREAPLNITSMTKRIYRTVSGTYKYVDEIPVATTTYSDTKVDADLGGSLATDDYDMPPTGMQGIVSMANGLQVGFVDNQLCFCEPYLPHAWPEKYRVNTDTAIVAIATWGISVVIGTTHHPYRVTGVNPSLMSKSKIERDQACVSKESMRALKSGVAYASPDGIVYIDSNGAILATNHILKKKEWQLFAPASLRAGIYDNRYYAWYENGGAEQDEQGGIVFDPEEKNAQFVTLSSHVTCAWSDRENDTLYIVEGGVIKEWEAGGSEYTANWHSKDFILPRQAAFSCAQVHLEYENAIPQSEYDAALTAGVQSIDDAISNGTQINNGSLGGFMPAQYTVDGGPYLDVLFGLSAPSDVTLSIYKDGVLAYSKKIDDENAFRIPAGALASRYSLSISSSQARVKAVILAENMNELGEV